MKPPVFARLSRRIHDSRGSITPFVLIVSIGFLLLAALVIDGGRQLNSKGRAVAYAQAAARAGAQAIDVTNPRLQIIQPLAKDVAEQYCRNAMSRDPQLVACKAYTVRRLDDTGTPYALVGVKTEVDIDTVLLSMFGASTLSATGEAASRPMEGRSEADLDNISTLPPPTVKLPGGGMSGSPTATGPTEVPTCVPSPTETTPTETESTKPPKESTKPPKDTPSSPGDENGDDQGNGGGGNNGQGDDEGDDSGKGGDEGDDKGSGGGDDKPADKPSKTPTVDPSDICLTDIP